MEAEITKVSDNEFELSFGDVLDTAGVTSAWIGFGHVSLYVVRHAGGYSVSAYRRCREADEALDSFYVEDREADDGDEETTEEN